MHELSIALSILDIAAEEARRHDGARVVSIRLKLGPLSGVQKEALLSAYDLARETSEFARCELIITDVPIVVYCETCAAERSVVSIQEMACSVCGQPAPRVIRGRELEISAMEICQ